MHHSMMSTENLFILNFSVSRRIQYLILKSTRNTLPIISSFTTAEEMLSKRLTDIWKNAATEFSVRPKKLVWSAAADL